jgi:predicted nucleotide-binding protein (sugar kinase/HSP70/actin superfamily)
MTTSLKYIVRLQNEAGNRLASFPCENDSHVLEVVNELLAGTLDIEHNIRIDRVERDDA